MTGPLTVLFEEEEEEEEERKRLTDFLKQTFLHTIFAEQTEHPENGLMQEWVCRKNGKTDKTEITRKNNKITHNISGNPG
jgi:hypothetical protein